MKHTSLTHDQARRYARNIMLPGIGETGQLTLLNARVLVVGAGGLGSAVISYLATAGVGTLGIIDGDRVELSNLQRQILHETGDIGRLKVESAADRVNELNPDVSVIPHPHRLEEANAKTLIRQYDLVVDGCDNFTTRFVVHDACMQEKVPLVSAAIRDFGGQISTFKAYMGAEHPCYHCLVPEMPPEARGCSETGVVGALVGIMGSMQAMETVKELLALGQSLSGRLLVYDALRASWRETRLHKDPGCHYCGN